MPAKIEPTPAFLELIRPYAGALATFEASERSFTDLIAVAEGERGRFFIKAMKNRPGGRRDQMVRERVINPYVRNLAPALLWSAEDGDWIVLGFEYVEGQGADFLPESPDLPRVVDLVNRIGEVTVPDPARQWRETRWDWWADEGAPVLFRGDALLYTDINPSNFVFGEDRAWVVDWSWPTRGAAFIDPAMFVLQLVAAEHTPEAAEAWASGCPAWADADPEAVDAFVIAYVRMLRHSAARRPDQPWRAAMVDAGEAWAAYRGLAVS